MRSDQRSDGAAVRDVGKPFGRRSSSTAALLTAFAALGCYQSYAEPTDGDHDTFGSPEDAPFDVRDDGVPADSGLDGDAHGDANVDADADVVDAALVPCAGGLHDPVSGLCWQQPTTWEEMRWTDAIAYCAALDLGGYGPGSWHLPSISELRSFIRGCPATMPGGECGLTDSCLEASCRGSGCFDCAHLGGPGLGGCYWDPAVRGRCDDCFWSSSAIAGGTELAGLVRFFGGWVDEVGSGSTLRVRCVRPGP